jgi:hypothetical protein
MRWRISPHLRFRPGRHFRINPKNRDPRAIDALAIVALLALVLGSGWYLATSFATTPATTAFIVPSQSVRW